MNCGIANQTIFEDWIDCISHKWIKQKRPEKAPQTRSSLLFIISFVLGFFFGLGMSTEMFECIKATGLFKNEDEGFIREIADLAEANTFKCKGAQSATQIFGDSDFVDWNFDLRQSTPSHEQAVCRMLQKCNKDMNATTLENVYSEDGELNEELDGIKTLSQMFRKSVRSSQSTAIHVETAAMLGQKCGNWGEAKHFVLPSSEGTNLMARELAKLKALNIQKPFVKVPLNKFTPEWCNESKADGFLLQPAMLMPHCSGGQWRHKQTTWCRCTLR